MERRKDRRTTEEVEPNAVRKLASWNQSFVENQPDSESAVQVQTT